jgi:hypothetical protein
MDQGGMAAGTDPFRHQKKSGAYRNRAPLFFRPQCSLMRGLRAQSMVSAQVASQV